MTKLFKTAAIGLAAASMVAAAPASATIFEYTMNNGDVLTIDSDAGTGTWSGDNIDATFTGDFSNFEGGANPSFAFTLTELNGTRNINGQDLSATNCRSANSCHPYMLKSSGNGRINLWSWWGNPVGAGDYVRSVVGYTETDVPAPGMLGLFGLALAALGLGWRRRKAAA